MAKDLETKQRFIELRASGWSYDKIARELGVSKVTLIQWSKGLEHEIANLKAIELESLLEQYYLSRVKRIELLGEKLRALKNELETRDLKDVSTDRLVTLFLKLYELAKAEAVEPVFAEAEREAISLDDLSALGTLTLKTWTG